MGVMPPRSRGLSSSGPSGKSLVSASGRGADSTVRDRRSRREAGHDGRRPPLQETVGSQRPGAGCGPRRDGLAGDPPPQRGGENKQHQCLQLLLDASGHLRHAHGVRRRSAARRSNIGRNVPLPSPGGSPQSPHHHGRRRADPHATCCVGRAEQSARDPNYIRPCHADGSRPPNMIAKTTIISPSIR